MTADPSEADPLTGARRIGGVSIGAPPDCDGEDDDPDEVVHLRGVFDP